MPLASKRKLVNVLIIGNFLVFILLAGVFGLFGLMLEHGWGEKLFALIFLAIALVPIYFYKSGNHGNPSPSKDIDLIPARNIGLAIIAVIIYFIIHQFFKFDARFINPLLDGVVGFVWALFVLITILNLKNALVRWIGVVLYLPLFLLAILISLLLLWGSTVFDGVEKPIDVIDMKGYKVVSYLTNYGGIVGDFGALVEQQWSIFPGIIYTKRIFSHGDCIGAKLKYVREDTITINSCFPGNEDTREYTLTK